MSAYANDSRVMRTPQDNFIVDQRWAVVNTQHQWEAWPFPDCAGQHFDVDDYRARGLIGAGRATSDEAIHSLIGDPQ